MAGKWDFVEQSMGGEEMSALKLGEKRFCYNTEWKTANGWYIQPGYDDINNMLASKWLNAENSFEISSFC